MQEKEIIEGCRRLDRQSQREFVNKYSSYLYGVCLRYMKNSNDAQDCLQEALIRILNKIEYFEPNGSFKAWISKVTANECLQFIRKYKKVNFIEIHESQIMPSESGSDAKLDLDQVLMFLNQLPDKYRIAINMYLIEGYSHKEIAQRLNINESSSRSLVSRARKMIIAEFGNSVTPTSYSKEEIVIKYTKEIQSKRS